MRVLFIAVAMLFAVGNQPDELQTTKARYLMTIHKKVLESAAKRGVKGSVTVVVDIEKTGHLSSLRVKKSSGHPAVDESVLRAVLTASPFGPLPAELGLRLIEVEIKVDTFTR